MATVESRLKKLEDRQCWGKPVFKDTLAEFPVEGKINRIYIDRSNGAMYIWDGNGYITVITPSPSITPSMTVTPTPTITPTPTPTPSPA